VTRQEAFEFLRRVENEFFAARFAVRSIESAIHRDPTLLSNEPESIRPSYLRDCLVNLETTYLLRLFAEFEWVLRDLWASARQSPRLRRTRMEILIHRVASRLSMPKDTLDDVQAVRGYRNQLVHRTDSAAPMTFRDCKSVLARYLSFFPLRW
jgi:hypothetical protein